MQVFVFLFVAFSLFAMGALFSPDFYLFELWRSFGPLIFWLHIFLIIVSCCGLFFFSRRNEKNSSFSFRLLLWMVALCNLFLGAYWLVVVDGFYEETAFVDENGNGVKVFYANMYIHNDQLDSFLGQIKEEKADIVVLVEYGIDAHDRFKDYFQSNYAYVNRLSWDIGQDGTLIASRFPLKDVTVYEKPYVDMLDYVLSLPEKQMLLSALHTSSPILYGHFRRRNQHLSSILKRIRKLQRSYSELDHIVLGDFNVSPRSSFYDRFVGDDHSLSSGADSIDLNASTMTSLTMNSLGFSNVTRRIGKHITWCLDEDSRFVCSHIDHIFVREQSEGFVVDDLRVFDALGSDHDAYVFSISDASA